MEEVYRQEGLAVKEYAKEQEKEALLKEKERDSAEEL